MIRYHTCLDTETGQIVRRIKSYPLEGDPNNDVWATPHVMHGGIYASSLESSEDADQKAIAYFQKEITTHGPIH